MRRALQYSLALLLALNAVVFTAVATNHFVDHDEWFFVKTVVMPYVDGELGLRDLYVMRASSDHALPVQKLLLIASVELTQLDYHFQAFIGIACAVLFAVVVCRRILRTVPADGNRFTPELVVIMVLAVYFSLNSTVTFSWPLTTLGYLNQCMLLLLFVVTDAAILGDRVTPARMAVVTAVVLVVADDAGVLGVLCSLLVLSIFALAQRRRDLRDVVLCMLFLLVGYRFFIYAELASYVRSGGGSALQRGLQYFMQDPLEIYKAMSLPFANGVLHRIHFDRLLGAWGQPAHVVFGLCIFVLNLAAWHRYIGKKGYLVTIVPALLVLFSYLTLAGILVVRVPSSGHDYFNMPRYTRLYQAGMVGIIWMWNLRHPDAAPETAGPRGTWVNAAIFTVVLAATIVSSVFAWSQVWRQHVRQDKYERFLLQLADNPRTGCNKTYVICRKYRPNARELIVTFLRDHRLNVFNDKMHRRREYQFLRVSPTPAATSAQFPDGT